MKSYNQRKQLHSLQIHLYNFIQFQKEYIGKSSNQWLLSTMVQQLAQPLKSVGDNRQLGTPKLQKNTDSQTKTKSNYTYQKKPDHKKK